MFLGRSDPRLFDEVLDWYVANEEWLSIQRLKALIKLFHPAGVTEPTPVTPAPIVDEWVDTTVVAVAGTLLRRSHHAGEL